MALRLTLTLCVLVFGAVVPALEVNDTHVFNSHWPAHARLHEVWQLNTNALLALLCTWLAWRDRVFLASLVALCVTPGFLLAYLLRQTYGGSMLGVDGSEKILAGVNVSMLAVHIMTLLTMVLSVIVLLSHRERAAVPDAPRVRSELGEGSCGCPLLRAFVTLPFR